MKIFNYDAFNGQFISETDADESPLEPGVFLIPAFATEIQPPEQEGYNAHFIDGDWQLVAIPQPVIPTEEELIAIASEAVRQALQVAIDAKARELGFSGGNALMLYVGFTNAFQATAQVFATWEVSVWVEAGEYKDQVIAGTAPMLSPEEAVAMMPELVMP